MAPNGLTSSDSGSGESGSDDSYRERRLTNSSALPSMSSMRRCTSGRNADGASSVVSSTLLLPTRNAECLAGVGVGVTGSRCSAAQGALGGVDRRNEPKDTPPSVLGVSVLLAVASGLLRGGGGVD
jgi:hypothetical protein